MKNIITYLFIVAAITLGACNSKTNAEKKKQAKAQTEVTKSTIQLSKGNVEVFDYGTVKMHAYFTKDMMNDLVIVLEKNGKAALIESPAFWDNYDEFRNYLSTNNIIVEAILPSYHPLGGNFIETEALKDIDVYFTQNVLDYWETGFGSVMKAGIPKAFGDKVDAQFYIPTKMIEEGEIEIAGIKIQITNTYDGYDIEIPEINTVYVHILGHDVHSEILGHEHLDLSIKHFKGYLSKGYTRFLSSHYGPENKVDMETKVAYLENMEKIIAKSKTSDEFVKNMKTAYPDYKEGYLMASARSFYSNQAQGHQH
ncbi:hypothetical protein [Labilibacter marinus]|uniref:hypothetical protein n=1 Tax=Labilibacter marinus TaxID=1477105 RepID=UPI0009F9927E|nr:hypothetical protein [Labilibacter marinus]